MTIVNARYVGLVETTLNEEWRNYQKPLSIPAEDLRAGTLLLTKIAISAIGKAHSAEESKEAFHPVSLDTQPSYWFIDKIEKFIAERVYAYENPHPTRLSAVEQQIRAFVQAKAAPFRRACQTGFPFSLFSLLEGASTERALRQVLENSDASLVFHLMTLEKEWMDEKELDARFGDLSSHLEIDAIIKACSHFRRAYLTAQDNRAGYYLLWLIKQATGCAYEIPAQDSFDPRTVTELLSQFVLRSGSPLHVQNFIEILHSRTSSEELPLYREFLNRDPSSLFLRFTVAQCKTTPMHQWPRKAKIIIDLLETLTMNNRLFIAKELATSPDPTTSAVGRDLSRAFEARSLKETIFYLNGLRGLLPSLNETHIERIFGHPFAKFCIAKPFTQGDSACIKRLCFNVTGEVFIHENLMIGVYQSSLDIPPYLLAYEMRIEHIVWGIPLTPMLLETPVTFNHSREAPSHYILQQTGAHLSLQFLGEKKRHFIDPATGEVASTLALPRVFKKSSDSLHVNQDGFVYQVVDQGKDYLLIGGRMIDNEWQPSFTFPDLHGDFQPLSTHCGFQHKEGLVLFGPTGEVAALENCIAALADGDRLYTIERDPLNERRSLLAIRRLRSDDQVISKVETTIPLDVKPPTFGALCQNGELILLADHFSHISPIFIDLESYDLVYSPYKLFSDAYFINRQSGELWIWGQISEKIVKVSSRGNTFMGYMKNGQGAVLLHADQADYLYVVDLSSKKGEV